MEKFEKKVQASIKEMISLGYKPKILMSMIFETDTITAVKKLLSNTKPAEGFLKLWEMGRLDLSMENIVYSEDWGELFTKKEKKMAKEKLEEYNFIKKE